MAVFNKLNGFVEHLAEGVHDLGSNQLVLALSNVAPGAESTAPTSSTNANCILGNVTQDLLRQPELSQRYHFKRYRVQALTD